MVAKRLLDRKEGELSQGKLPGILFEKVAFEELAADFIRDYKINKKKSIVRARRSVGHLKKTFEGMVVPQITSPKINEHIELRIDEGAANATINRELSALKRMLNLGARQTPPKVDRVPYIPMLKENNARKGFFEHEEYLSLKAVIADYLKGFITFAYKSGWRFSEIVNLKWSNVDLGSRVVWLYSGTTKNDDGRTIYLDDELIIVFEEQKRRQLNSGRISPYVFSNNQGTDRIVDFRKSWKKACKTAGIPGRIFHDFRRTAVRNMVRAGIPERVAMMISGHKTRSVFDRYDIVNETDLMHAAKQQEAYLRNLSQTQFKHNQPFFKRNRV